jgi:hypothetical protein
MGMGMSLEETIRRDIKMMDKHERVVSRDLVRMEREKKDVVYKIKSNAKKGNMEMVDSLTTEYLLFKANINKMTKLKGHLSNVKQKIRLMSSVHQINKAFVSLTDTMKIINEQVGTSSLTGIIKEYEQEIQKVEVSMELHGEALDADIDEDERTEIIHSVLDEIGVEFGESMQAAPKSTNAENDVERALQQRLNGLLG